MMTTTTPRSVLAALALFAGTLCVAQDQPLPSGESAPEPTPVPVVATATPAAVSSSVDAREQRLWSLAGGGEIIGILVKETPQEIFVDIGPRIIGIPRDGILASMTTREAAGAKAGLGENAALLASRARTEGGVLLGRAEIVEQAKKSVVLISNPRGAGSGFVLDTEGRLVTNHHVINTEKYHTVNLFRKRGAQWERVKIENVEVEAYSPLYDIAILKLDTKKAAELGVELVPMKIAPPNSLAVGDNVFAIGNPGTVMPGGGRLLEHSVTEGIVSSLARNVNDVLYLQTTAAVNPGNSGGPLVNQRGEVVGLVTLKAVFQEGIAFALPTSLMWQFLENSESYAYSEQSRNRGFRYLSPE